MSATELPANGIVVSQATVLDNWLDYNDHMNVSYYVAAFDIGIDETKATLGMTPDYIAANKRSTVALEAHITYQQEALGGDALRIETRIVDCDAKRIHYYQEMYRDQTLLSTQESLGISFDLAARRTSEFPPEIAAAIAELQRRQTALDRPGALGRQVGIRRKSTG